MDIKVPINNDLRDFFHRMKKNSKNFSINKKEWTIKALKWKQKYPAVVVNSDRKQKKYVNPYFFMEQLSKQLKSDVIVADDGGHLTWAVQGLKIKKKSKDYFRLLEIPLWAMLYLLLLEHQVRKIKKNYMYRWGWKYSNKYTRLQTIITYKLQ